jgi:hypothetical protein
VYHDGAHTYKKLELQDLLQRFYDGEKNTEAQLGAKQRAAKVADSIHDWINTR